MNIQEIINTSLRTRDIEQRQEYWSQEAWHPSCLGTCLTGAFLKRNGILPEYDDRLLRVFSIGKQLEDWVADRLRDAGATFEEQIPIEIPEWNVKGTADFILKDGEVSMPIELKSKNSRAFWYMEKKHEGANRHHMMQLWTYLKALNLPEGRIVYISKDDLVIAEYPIYLDDISLEREVTDQFELLNKAWDASLPPAPITDSKDWRYKYCSIHSEHCLRQEKYYETTI